MTRQTSPQPVPDINVVRGVVRPITDDAPLVGREESAIVQGVTRTGTGANEYKTEFVKVYQDAGVIGVSMLTLLVLSFLMGLFAFRILKMYTKLVESKDQIDQLRLDVQERVVVKLVEIHSKIDSVISELRSDHTGQSAKLDSVLIGQNNVVSRLDRLMDRNQNVDREIHGVSKADRDDADARDYRRTDRIKITEDDEDAREFREDPEQNPPQPKDPAK